MNGTATHDRRASVPAVVGAVSVAALVSLALGALAVTVLPLPAEAHLVSVPWVVAAFVAAAAASELFSVPLLHGEESEDLTFYEIVTVAGILVLTPQWAVLAPLLGLLVVQVALRTTPVKAVFNLSSYAVATTGAVLTYLVLCGGEPVFSTRGVVALVAGMAVFAVVNTLLLAAVLNAADGTSPKEVVTDLWGIPVLTTLGSVGVGATAVFLAPVAPALVPFTLLPAFTLLVAYRSTAQRAEERARNEWLVRLAGQLITDRGPADLAADATESVRRAFGAPVAVLLTPTSGQLLQPTSDQPAPVPSYLVPDGWASAVAVGVDLDGEHRGALLLGSLEGDKRRWSLKESDAALLTTVASSLSAALRGAGRLAALVEESGKLTAVVENASDGIAVVAADGSVRLWSRSMARITGVPEADALACSPLPTLAAVVAAAWPARGASQRTETTALTLTRPDGEEREVSVSVAHAVPRDGSDPLAVVTVHDVTAQARADRLKSDFVATISHELRTPITPIKGYAQLLLARGDQMPPERRRSAYALIAERADHLGRLVEDLLMASRASGTLASKLGTAPEQLDLRTVVAAAVDSVPAVAEQVEVQEPATTVPVWCDQVRTVQILANLLSNAAKYAPGSAVEIRVHEPEFGDTHAIVDVVDHGAGIAADELDRIFERFYRIEDSMTMRAGGSGLGLWIARELAVAMGGALTATSCPGQGSTFTLTLPRNAPAADSTTHTPPVYARTA
jgi:PAS domain S-box-containing protein